MNKKATIRLAVILLALILIACHTTLTSTAVPTTVPMAAFPPTSTATPAPTPIPSLSGRVIDAATGVGISGFVYTSDGTTSVSNVHLIADCATMDFEEGLGALSNSNGSYMIKGLPPGNYRVHTEGVPYAGEFYNSRSTQGTADQVVVSAGHNTPNINFTLDEGGTITGHVFDEETGKPLLEIDLWAFLPDGNLAALHDPTSYDGSYKIILKPGEYLIWTGGPLLGYGYVPEWYDNAHEMSGATLVTVTLHQETSGIDFYLARAGSISDHVYESDGTTPISSANVYAFCVAGSHPGNGANTGPDGTYTIVGLPSGVYKVQAIASDHAPAYYNDSSEEASATEVRVNAPGDTPSIDFLLSLVAE
jgi:hypothetical protein